MYPNESIKAIEILSNRATNYVAKIFDVCEPADKDDMRQAAALRMLETGDHSFDEARRGADAWLKAWRKRDANMSLSEHDSNNEQKKECNTEHSLALIDQLTNIHLSPTQWSVLNAVVAGKNSKTFATISGMSERSIWTHRQRVRKALKNHLDSSRTNGYNQDRF